MLIKCYIRVLIVEYVDSFIVYYNDVRFFLYICNFVYNIKYLNVYKIILMYLLLFFGYGFF